jgi:GntR family transcriptional regulator
MVSSGIDRNSVIAIYEQIAAHLQEQIETGVLKPGQGLPTEPELMTTHGTSRSTIRAALALLKQQGILTSRRGKGTFVARRELKQELNELHSLPEAMAAQGFVVSLKPLVWEITLPQVHVQQQLGLKDGEKILRLDKLHLLDDEPVATDSLALPAWVSERVGIERLLTNSTYQVLEQAGLSLGAAWQRVSAVAATRDIAQHLNLHGRDPVLRIERLTYSQTGVPIEYLNLFYRADRVVLEVNMPRHSLPLVFEPTASESVLPSRDGGSHD